MRTTDLKDLLSTVEALRNELHPDLDASFIEAVVRAEEQNPEDDAEASRAVQAALTVALAAKGRRFRVICRALLTTPARQSFKAPEQEG